MTAPQPHDFTSFVEVASDSCFPLQNLPYGVFRPKQGGAAHIGVAIGEEILDLTVLERLGYLRLAETVFQQPRLNLFMALPSCEWQEARQKLSELLRWDNPVLKENLALRQQCLLRQEAADLLLPAEIGDYTDFYSSKEHASNVGAMFRDKDQPLLPNWLHLPVGYHGRASSIIVSGTNFHRPWGQLAPASGEESPVFAPSKRLDFELELAFFIGGKTNPLGRPIPLAEAEDSIFGLVVMNDWSARDIQRWEYQPLGPFVSKSFATSISPWVVPFAAIKPFAVAGPQQEPTPLPYLQPPAGSLFHYDIELEVSLGGERLGRPQRICRSNSRYLYWSMAQQIAHHTVTGCNLRPADLLASGTISGPGPETYGSLLELSWGGKKPLELANGEARSFLEDGDEVSISAWCQGSGYKVGFGTVTGKVLPAHRS